MISNWQTTAAGVGAILAALGGAITSISHGDWSVLSTAIPAIVAGVGLITARDATK